MSIYYNEWDNGAAAWLRELIAQGHIPAGHVDTRSITEIKSDELSQYTQCHFFAGIGGWSHALRLARWPGDEPVWTGSCPCQPFSAAGKQLGTADERHLWPAFFRLVAECRPSTVFGEQVASKAGRDWLAGVRADLEGVGYAVGAADLCAAGASTEVAGWVWIPDEADGDEGGSWIPVSAGSPHIRQRLYWVAHTDGGNAGTQREQRSWQHGQQPQDGGTSFWSRFDLLPCTDGKTRRIEPGSFPLAHGIPGRVGMLRGYGNAIVPQVAAEFIKAAGNAVRGGVPGLDCEETYP